MSAALHASGPALSRSPILPDYTVEQAATSLNCSTNTVRRLATRGTLQGYRVGRAWRFRPHAVELFKEQQKHRAEAPLVAAGKRGRVTPKRNVPLKGWHKFAHGT